MRAGRIVSQRQPTLVDWVTRAKGCVWSHLIFAQAQGRLVLWAWNISNAGAITHSKKENPPPGFPRRGILLASLSRWLDAGGESEVVNQS